MQNLEDQLLDECRRIAETTMWNHSKRATIDDVITAEEREAVARAYFDIAQSHIASVRDYPEDPAVVLRAVSYLGGHAMPPIRDNVEWFREGLATLLLLVCPFASSPAGGEPFFADLRRGMDRADNWAREDLNT